MAIVGTDRGTFTNTTSAATTDFSPSGNFGAGSLAVLTLSADNSAAGGATENVTSVTDTEGNTWTKRLTNVYDPGAANEGIQCTVWTTPQDVGLLTTSTVITITYGANTAADAGTLSEVAPTAGYEIQYVTGAFSTPSTSNSPTITTSSIPIGDMVVGFLASEYGTSSTVTGDGDSSNGTWSTQQLARAGGGNTGITSASQRKVVTGAATQTYNPTLTANPDNFVGWAQFTEVALAGGAVGRLVGGGLIRGGLTSGRLAG